MHVSIVMQLTTRGCSRWTRTTLKSAVNQTWHLTAPSVLVERSADQHLWSIHYHYSHYGIALTGMMRRPDMLLRKRSRSRPFVPLIDRLRSCERIAGAYATQYSASIAERGGHKGGGSPGGVQREEMGVGARRPRRISCWMGYARRRGCWSGRHGRWRRGEHDLLVRAPRVRRLKLDL